jgi:hypothetical protein
MNFFYKPGGVTGGRLVAAVVKGSGGLALLLRPFLLLLNRVARHHGAKDGSGTTSSWAMRSAIKQRLCEPLLIALRRSAAIASSAPAFPRLFEVG